MELDRKQSAKLGRFAASVVSRYSQAKPWLTPRKVKTALLGGDSTLLAHVLEDGVGCLFDDNLRQALLELIEAIPVRRGNGVVERKRAASEERREALRADLDKVGSNLSEHGKLALVFALVAGTKGEARATAAAELCSAYGCTLPEAKPKKK